MIFRRSIYGLIAVAVAVSASGCSNNQSKTDEVKLTAMESVVKHDHEVADKIMDKISNDVMLKSKAESFQIMSVRGDTTIYGVVNSELEREHAERIAQETPGVKAVTSRIKLKSDAPPNQQTASAKPVSIQ